MNHKLLDEIIGDLPRYSFLLEALVDIYLITHDPAIEYKIINLIGADILQKIIENRGSVQ